MFLRGVLAVVLIYVVCGLLDFLVHGMLLLPAYEESAALWLPQEEMRMGLRYGVTFVAVVVFVLIYALLIEPKHLGRGLLYGLLYGIAAGTSMGYGSYSVMPIPYEMAFIWFANVVLQLLIAGGIVGAVIRSPKPG